MIAHPPRPVALALLLLLSATPVLATPALAATDEAPAPAPASPGATTSPALTAPPALAPTPTPPAPGTPAADPPAVAPAEESTAATPEAKQVSACKSHALERLKQGSPSITDIFIDMDGLTIAHADLKVGEAHVTSVLMGEAYIQRDRSDKVHRFLCLTGDDDHVLMTFFTEQ